MICAIGTPSRWVSARLEELFDSSVAGRLLSDYFLGCAVADDEREAEVR